MKQIPVPPFWGNRVIRDISPASLISYINRHALFNLHWELKGDNEKGEAILMRLLHEFPKSNLRAMGAAAVYGYYPCQSDGDALIVYRAPDRADVAFRLSFPRQKFGEQLAIPDFFGSVQSGKMDLVAFQLVSLGEKPALFEKQLYKSDQYQDYFYWHGFFAVLADALAEFIHQRIRVELGFVVEEPKELSGLSRHQYHGARFSFGYASCPNLADQDRVVTLLGGELIDVTLSEAHQLIPEYSTVALIAHSKQAKTFGV